VVVIAAGMTDAVMALSNYTAEFGAGVVVNGLDLNTDATKVLVGGRKGMRSVLFVQCHIVYLGISRVFGLMSSLGTVCFP